MPVHSMANLEASTELRHALATAFHSKVTTTTRQQHQYLVRRMFSLGEFGLGEFGILNVFKKPYPFFVNFSCLALPRVWILLLAIVTHL